MITVESMQKAGFSAPRVGSEYIPEKRIYLNRIEFRCVCGTEEVVCDYGDKPWTLDEALVVLKKSDALTFAHLTVDGYTKEDTERIREVLFDL